MTFWLKEVLSRSSAETHQLELLSEMSSIKLRYAALEKENCELRSQLKRSEQDMVALVSQVVTNSCLQYLENEWTMNDISSARFAIDFSY